VGRTPWSAADALVGLADVANRIHPEELVGDAAKIIDNAIVGYYLKHG
jgi:hypothetical protein